MPRARTGTVITRSKGKSARYYARVRYTDADGKSQEIYRRADSRTHARELVHEINREIKKRGVQGLSGDRFTFRELAAHYRKHYAHAPKYVNGSKVAGLRSYKKLEYQIEILNNHFGTKKLRHITWGSLRAYKTLRLNTSTRPTKSEPAGHQRSIAAVQRELALLRTMLGVALREGWIVKNPFHSGDSLISSADERERMRILSHDEERRLLEACGGRTVTYKQRGKEVSVSDDGAKRKHLRPLLVAALDTAMREGELLKLQWTEVDRKRGIIRVLAFNTKTMKPRVVPITARLDAELAALEAKADDPSGLVFGIKSNVKRSFAGALGEAKITDFRFHDLRHTAITWMLEAGNSPAKVMKISGHTNMKTFLRYVNVNEDTARDMATLMDERRARMESARMAATAAR